MTAFNESALLVPQRAVSELQGRDQIAVVGPGNKVTIRTVDMGERVGEMWIVSSGLKPGEQVVSEGTAKVRDGQIVNPQPDTLKAESPYPVPSQEN